MTAASNSEARKRAAGFAASNLTDPEHTGTLEGAPGADSEALAAQILAALRDAWHDEYSALTVAEKLTAAILGSSWLADRDRQIAEHAWFECLQAITWATNNGPDPIEYVAANNPYSEEARRG